MVNLRGGLRGLGAALTTIGTQGIEEQQRVAADRRLLDREAAFARIQQGIRRQDQDEDVKRDLGRAEAETPVLIEREARTLKVREPYRAAEDERTAARAETAADRADARQEARDSRADARAADREEAAERRAAAQRGDEVVDRFTNEQGHRVLVLRSGEERTLTSRVRPTRSDDEFDDEPGGDGVPVERVRAATERIRRATEGRGGRPVLTARPATRQGNEQPPFPGARRAPDGHWYVSRNGRNFRVEE